MKKAATFKTIIISLLTTAVCCSFCFINVKADTYLVYDNYSITNTYGMVEINGTWRRQTTVIINCSDVVNGNMQLYFDAQGPSSSSSVSTTFENYHMYAYNCKINVEDLAGDNTYGNFWIRLADTNQAVIIFQNTAAYNNTSTGAAYAYVTTNPDDFGGTLNTDYDSCIVSSSSSGSSSDYSTYLDTLIVYSTQMSTYLEQMSSYDSTILDMLSDVDSDGNYVSKLDTIIELLEEESETVQDISTDLNTVTEDSESIQDSYNDFDSTFDDYMTDLPSSTITDAFELLQPSISWLALQMDYLYTNMGTWKIILIIPLFLYVLALLLKKGDG